MATKEPATNDRYHHGNLRAALLDSALEVLSESGVAGFSMREAARRAGVSQSAPKHHFGDARGLLGALATRAYRQLCDRLAVINPGAVIGPLLSEDPGTSVMAIQQIMAGALPMIPDLRLPWVHVRDVADAHIEAMTSESAGANRTIVATDPSSLIDVAAVLRERLPEASGKMPTRAMPTWLTWVASAFEPQLRDNRWLIGAVQRFDRGPAEALLGRPLRSIPDTIEETGRSLVERGLV